MLNALLKHYCRPDVIRVVNSEIALIEGRIVQRAGSQAVMYIYPFALI
jgi:hypothetical protein